MGKNQLIVRISGALILVLCIAGFFYWKSKAAKPAAPSETPEVTSDSSAKTTVSAPAIANVPAPSTEPDVLAGITTSLLGDKASEKKLALAQIHALADESAFISGDILKDWMLPLIDARQYADVEALSLNAILNKPYDQVTLEVAQQGRAQAQMAQKNYAQALIEAKGYYNIVSLEHLQDAVDMVDDAMSAKDPTAAGQFKASQVGALAAPVTFDAAATQPSADAPKGLLASVVVDPAVYQGTIKRFRQRKPSNTGLRGLGAVLLLADMPADALTCWASAATMAGNSAKSNRLSIQGVVASMRAMDGNPARGNALILALRKKDTSAVSIFPDAGDGAGLLFTAAGQCPVVALK